ncbi:MAG: endonuclease domain-containing protein [Xanthobacteraceae bacterium]
MSMASTVHNARRLRKHQTDAERVLWFRLRDRRLGGWKFRRQKSLNGFVVDFCCPDAKLVVELDGGQHSERQPQDERRTRNLEASGYLVLRFWNHDVLQNTDGVLEEILDTINQQQALEPPHPTPLPVGEREPA